LGNVADRAFRAEDGLLSGAVVDFIDLGWWPVFNVADSAIVVGVLAIIVFTLFEPVEPPTEEASDPSTTSAEAVEGDAPSSSGDDADGAVDEDQPGSAAEQTGAERLDGEGPEAAEASTIAKTAESTPE
jgi:signal peptidase II